MPLINGLKMACEPCIRGHRSTTCNHSSERVMVPVRKPGRPLNDCPHPRGSNCGCRDLTVAIPRKRKCECAGDKSTAPKTSITQTSAEASRPGSASPSVKEQPSEVASCCQPKAPAIPPANIPLTMPTSSAPVPQPPIVPLNGTSGPQWSTNWNWNFGAMNSSHVGHTFQGFGSPLQQATQPLQPLQSLQPLQPIQPIQPAQPSQQPVLLVSKRSESDDEAETTSSQGSTPFAVAEEPPVGSSCCSTRSSSTAQFAPTPGTTSPESNASSYAGHSRSNSKSRTAPMLRLDRPNTASRTTVVSQAVPDTASRAPFPLMVQSPVSQVPMQPITAHPPSCTNCGHNQPAILIYLPFGHPTQPMGYAGTGGPVYIVQQPTPMNIPSQPEFPRIPPLTAVTVPMGGCASDSTGLGTIHECNCGPGCECIGCIVHPYNDATQDYIRSAQNTFEDFGSPFQGMSELDPAAVPAAQSIANLSLSPEQILAPEDFFFVDYSSAQRGYP